MFYFFTFLLVKFHLLLVKLRTRCYGVPTVKRIAALLHFNLACAVVIVDLKVTKARGNFVEDEYYHSLSPDISVTCARHVICPLPVIPMQLMTPGSGKKCVLRIGWLTFLYLDLCDMGVCIQGSGGSIMYYYIVFTGNCYPQALPLSSAIICIIIYMYMYLCMYSQFVYMRSI